MDVSDTMQADGNHFPMRLLAFLDHRIARAHCPSMLKAETGLQKRSQERTEAFAVEGTRGAGQVVARHGRRRRYERKGGRVEPLGVT